MIRSGGHKRNKSSKFPEKREKGIDLRVLVVAGRDGIH